MKVKDNYHKAHGKRRKKMTTHNRQQIKNFFYRIIVIEGYITYKYYKFWYTQWTTNSIKMVSCGNSLDNLDVVNLNNCYIKMGVLFSLEAEDIKAIIKKVIPQDKVQITEDNHIICESSLFLVNQCVRIFNEEFSKKFNLK